MAKRVQQGTGEERIVAKSKPTLNLVSKTEASSSTVLSANASNRPAILRAPSQKGLILLERMEKPEARDSNQKDAASSSQVWQKDAQRDESTRRLVALEAENQNPSTVTRRCGRTTSTYLLSTFHSLKKNSRT